MESRIKDIKLAEKGKRQLEWAERHMPTLMQIRSELKKAKPLKGKRVAMMLHVTKETGVLARTIKDAGAEVFLAGSNPLSTQDDIAAALVDEGMNVFAWRGQNDKDYVDNMKIVLGAKPDLIMDDGADLHSMIHKEKEYQSLKIIGGTEETTTGITRLKAMEAEKKLRYPVIAVNNALTKYLFDNRYGTGQSGVDGLIRGTNILISGKVAVIAGYGWVGRGVAMRMHGMGARVIVTEVDPFKALEAIMDGFEVRTMAEAAKEGELFVTCTGDIKVITLENVLSMKDGAILANVGHFDVEIDMKKITAAAKKVREIRNNLNEYELKNGKKIYIVAEGRLANLGAAEGHPSEVMDMSFSNQALGVVFIMTQKKGMVYNVPKEIDEKIATLKLASMGVSIDSLTAEQKEYMTQWEYGT